MKNTCLMVHCISNFECTSYNKIQDTAISSFISCCFTSAFTSADITFYNFLEPHSTFSEKRFFVRIFRFSFFSGLTQPLLVPPHKHISLRSQSNFRSLVLKTFNGIVLAFLLVKSKTNILYVNKKFAVRSILGFGRYCGKVLPQPALFFTFFERLHSPISLFQYFFTLSVST